MRLAPATPLLLLFACALGGPFAAGAAGADALTKDVDAPVAVVNGETISESELMRGVPKGIFGRSRQWAREARLAMLIDLMTLRQHLAAIHEIADEAAVASAFAETMKHPPVMGCGCVYQNFDDYLAQNCFTADDARTVVANDLGVAKAIADRWEQVNHGAAGKAALIASEGPAIRAAYRSFWRMPFALGPEERNDDPAHRGPGYAKAAAVMGRLRAGEDFAAVAKDIGGVADWGKCGGYAGMVANEDAVLFGLDKAHLDALPAGEVAGPLPGYMGYQLVRWAVLSDEDVLSYLKNVFETRTGDEIRAAALAKRTIEYVGSGKALAPRPVAH
jgi:hypothetical protein